MKLKSSWSWVIHRFCFYCGEWRYAGVITHLINEGLFTVSQSVIMTCNNLSCGCILNFTGVWGSDGADESGACACHTGREAENTSWRNEAAPAALTIPRSVGPETIWWPTGSAGMISSKVLIVNRENKFCASFEIFIKHIQRKKHALLEPNINIGRGLPLSQSGITLVSLR